MMTFKESMASIHQRAEEVAKLAGRGDPLATKVMSYYTQAWKDFHAVGKDEAKMDPALKANLIAATNEYMIRDLTISDLADLQSKFGHRTEGRPSHDIKKMN